MIETIVAWIVGVALGIGILIIILVGTLVVSDWSRERKAKRPIKATESVGVKLLVDVKTVQMQISMLQRQVDSLTAKVLYDREVFEREFEEMKQKIQEANIAAAIDEVLGECKE